MLTASPSGFWGHLHSAALYLYQLALGLGGPGLFVLALADSSFLSVPEGNDLLIVVLSTGRSWPQMAYYVAMTVMGSVAGCSILYLVGRRGGSFVQKRLSVDKLERLSRVYSRWGLWAVLIPSVLPPPTPFKIFVLSAGVFALPFRRFFLAVLVGRGFRYSVWGILAVLYGERAKRLVEENLNTGGLVLLGVGIAVGFFYWLRQRGKEDKQGAL